MHTSQQQTKDAFSAVKVPEMFTKFLLMVMTFVSSSASNMKRKGLIKAQGYAGDKLITALICLDPVGATEIF